MGQLPQDCDPWRRVIGVRRLAALIILATGFSFAFSTVVAGPPQSKPAVTRLNPLVSPDDSEPLTSSPASKPWSSMGARLIYPYSIIVGDGRSAREMKIATSKNPHPPRFHSPQRAPSLKPIRKRIIILDIPHPWSYMGAAVHI